MTVNKLVITITCSAILWHLLLNIGFPSTFISKVALANPNLSEISGRMSCFPGDFCALGSLNGSDLSVVDFISCYLSELAVQGLCKGSPNLKRLRLKNVAYNNNLKSVDVAVQSIVTNCPKIETLSLDGWPNLTADSMVFLSQLDFLRELSLVGCRSLTSDAVQTLVRANQRLETLIFSDDWDVEYDHEPSFVNAALLNCIGSNCPRLSELMFELPETSDVTDAVLTDMVRGCPLLKELRLTEFKEPNTLLPTLVACCPLLKRLFLCAVSFTDNDLLALCQGCSGLLSLRLPECQGISNTSVNIIASHCKKLEELMLVVNEDITDASLSALFSSCTDLRSVHLGLLVQLTSESVLALLHNCPLLQSLGLDWRGALIDDAISACTDESEAAELVRSKAITDATLAEIPVCCKGLKILRLFHCNYISRAGVCALMDSCKHLTELQVRNCKLAKPTAECCAKCEAISLGSRGLGVCWF